MKKCSPFLPHLHQSVKIILHLSVSLSVCLSDVNLFVAQSICCLEDLTLCLSGRKIKMFVPPSIRYLEDLVTWVGLAPVVATPGVQLTRQVPLGTETPFVWEGPEETQFESSVQRFEQ
jgi:hypothetical protein